MISVGFVMASMSRRGGGLFSSVRGTAQALIEIGVDVSVYAMRDPDSDADLDSWYPIVPRVLDVKGPAQFGYAPDLGPALLGSGHHVLHQHGIWRHYSAAVWSWGRRTGRPVVVSPHGMLDPWAVRNSGWKKKVVSALYEGRNLRDASCLHALNVSEARSIASYVPNSRISVVPNGTDLVPDDAVARPLSGEGRRTLLFLGRLHPKKGLAELVEAWGLLRSEAPDVFARWKLVIAGWDDGGHKAALEARTAQLGLGGDVSFPGPLFGTDKQDALKGADAFILPSHSEGLPMGVLEAWAAGLPVLMTRACNLPEGFAAGAATEIPVEPGALAKAMAAGLARADLPAMGRRGRELVRTRFTWDSVAAAHLSVYRWMLSGGERPAALFDGGEPDRVTALGGIEPARVSP